MDTETFAAKLFDEIFGSFCEGDFEVDTSDIVTGLFVDAGLVEQVEFDPDEHVDLSDSCEPGDAYYQLTEAGRLLRAKKALPA